MKPNRSWNEYFQRSVIKTGPQWSAATILGVSGFDMVVDGVSTVTDSNGLEPEFDPGAFVCLNSNDSNSNGLPDLEDFANTNAIPLTAIDPDFVKVTIDAVGLKP